MAAAVQKVAAFTRRRCFSLVGATVLRAKERRLCEEWRRIADGADETVGAAALHLSIGHS
jgi:hypothetical protein